MKDACPGEQLPPSAGLSFSCTVLQLCYVIQKYDCAPMRENIEVSVHCVLLILLIVLQATCYIIHYMCDQALFSVSSKSLVPQNGWLFPPVCVSNSCIAAD